jgi:F0F1-type ATP synthase assembly protein I
MQDVPRSPRSEKLDGMNLGMQVLSYLIAGVALYGFLGWLGDQLLGTAFLLPVGIVLGAALGCYVIIRRFGRIEDTPSLPRGSGVVPPGMDTDQGGDGMITTQTGGTDTRTG